ncbi:VWA domain-containing protein [Ferdinandcohnia quinoae]|uniref:VWA domain-containing protein n=1 Tax=Fredinandcohnia quinoae TaxID=2918902 RepID=A0AAW5E8D5_9BACI|nr:VWA domain-containing protein [Fredinandcohnia sp. SECRCQ15]MCH1625900.1 VWA domain-containing protein [Fredinandcohnia sp. SECRCQ15]
MNKDFNYPFTAIIGQEKAKRALMLALTNPKIGSVLISGEKGTAKSTLVRGIAPLLNKYPIVELPLNATEEQVIGGVNVEQVIKTGVKNAQHGLLARANGRVLYVDEINLLSQNITNIIIETSASKVVHLAREGITDSYPSDFILIGTMNPEEGPLSSKFLDRFGLFVHVEGEKDVHVRKQIIKNRLAYEQDMEEFCISHRRQMEALMDQIQKASEILSTIGIPNEMRRLSAEISIQACCEGHRADILLIETAKAIAALNQETFVTITHMQEAASYVLPHRIRDTNEQQASPVEDNELSESDRENEQRVPETMNHPPHTESDQHHEKIEGEVDSVQTIDVPSGEIQLSLIEPNLQKDVIKREGNGKRNRTKTSKKIGRYVKSMYPKGAVNDIAFDATLRVASLYQKGREANGHFIVVHSSDIRQKVREKRTGKVILFVVDASGSMGVNKRMSIVKSTIMSLLQEAYQKRDKVGLITFANNDSKVLLEPTRSIERANRELREIPTGGNTPLALGLETALDKLKNLSYIEADHSPFLVLITDGRANANLSHEDQWGKSLQICEKIHSLNMKSMVIDTEIGFVKLGLAKELAQRLESSYFKMEEIESEEIVKTITRS